MRDIDKLKEIQRLSKEEGINLAGIARIFALVEENEQLRARIEHMLGIGHKPRVFTASASGDIVAAAPGERPRVASDSQALVLWQRRHVELRRVR